MLYALVIHFCTEILCGPKKINEAPTLSACEDMVKEYRRVMAAPDVIFECTTDHPEEQP